MVVIIFDNIFQILYYQKYRIRGNLFSLNDIWTWIWKMDKEMNTKNMGWKQKNMV